MLSLESFSNGLGRLREPCTDASGVIHAKQPVSANVGDDPRATMCQQIAADLPF
jgi:hypothetical protein